MGLVGDLILIELYVFGALTIIGVTAGLVQRNSELVSEMVMTRVSPDRAAMAVGPSYVALNWVLIDGVHRLHRPTQVPST